MTLTFIAFWPMPRACRRSRSSEPYLTPLGSTELARGFGSTEPMRNPSVPEAFQDPGTVAFFFEIFPPGFDYETSSYEPASNAPGIH